jgi:hypothetical protein
MTTKDRDKLTGVLRRLLSAGVTLTDILEVAAQAVVKNEGVRPSVAISRVYCWAHCKLDDINKGK